MSDCIPGWFGRPHAHRFVARHDERLIDRGFKFWGCDPVEAIKAAKQWIYLGDVCTRCGEWKPRPKPE